MSTPTFSCSTVHVWRYRKYMLNSPTSNPQSKWIKVTNVRPSHIRCSSRGHSEIVWKLTSLLRDQFPELSAGKLKFSSCDSLPGCKIVLRPFNLMSHLHALFAHIPCKVEKCHVPAISEGAWLQVAAHDHFFKRELIIIWAEEFLYRFFFFFSYTLTQPTSTL